MPRISSYLSSFSLSLSLFVLRCKGEKIDSVSRVGVNKHKMFQKFIVRSLSFSLLLYIIHTSNNLTIIRPNMSHTVPFSLVDLLSCAFNAIRQHHCIVFNEQFPMNISNDLWWKKYKQNKPNQNKWNDFNV